MATQIEFSPDERYLYERYTSTEAVNTGDPINGPDPHKVYLTVGNQRFTIGDIYSEDAAHTDWYVGC